jgi:Orsellinic acid/F9775 biosynthesis cluster protein D
MIYNNCKYAVLPSQVDSHLDSAKHRIPARQRRAIQEEIQAWPDLFQNEADLVRLQIPRHHPPRLEQLEIYVDGRKCNTCGHIMRTNEGIKKHCRTQHGWVNH